MQGSDYVDPPPSPVVFIRSLSDLVTEADLVNDLQMFGRIRSVFVLCLVKIQYVNHNHILLLFKSV